MLRIRGVILPLILTLGIVGVFGPVSVHADYQQSWTSNYTQGGLFPWGSNTGSVISSHNCGNCNGDGGQIYAESQSVGGGSSGGVMMGFEDRNPTGAGPYYYCNSGRCGFYLPNDGQSSYSLDVSGTFHLLGFIGADGTYFQGLIGHGTASIEVDLWIWQDQATSLDQTYYSNALLLDTVNCVTDYDHPDCGGSSSWNSIPYSLDKSFSVTGISLASGHFYHVGLRFLASVASTSQWPIASNAYACFWYTSGNGWTCRANYSNSPAACYLDSTCPSDAPSDICAANSPCYYVQWKSATYTIHGPTPDYSVSASPSSVNLHWASYGSSIITVQGIGLFSGMVTLSVQPAGWIDSNHDLYGYFYDSNNNVVTSITVSVPQAGSVTQTFYIQAYSWSNPPGPWTYTINADYSGTWGTLHHSPTVTVTLNYCCY